MSNDSHTLLQYKCAEDALSDLPCHTYDTAGLNGLAMKCLRGCQQSWDELMVVSHAYLHSNLGLAYTEIRGLEVLSRADIVQMFFSGVWAFDDPECERHGRLLLPPFDRCVHSYTTACGFKTHLHRNFCYFIRHLREHYERQLDLIIVDSLDRLVELMETEGQVLEGIEYFTSIDSLDLKFLIETLRDEERFALLNT